MEERKEKEKEKKEIPTAQEYLAEIGSPYETGITTLHLEINVLNYMKWFAKLPVEAALKRAAQEASVTTTGGHKYAREEHMVDQESILSAYPLSNIK